MNMRRSSRSFSEEDRLRLGTAHRRARMAMGLATRPQYVEASGINKRSLLDLEKGRVVGEYILEAVGRFLPGWTEDTAWAILEGAEPPVPPEMPSRTAVDTRVSPVITADADDPAFWFALQEEVPPERFRELRQMYLDKKAAERKLAERNYPQRDRAAETLEGARRNAGEITDK